MKKRLLSVFLSLCMVLTLLPATALAADETTLLGEAQAAQQALETALEDGNVTWSILYDATLSYNALDNETGKRDLTEYYASINSLDLSGQSIEAVYGFTDVGVLTPFTGLKVLDISNTGVTNIGGLNGMTSLESLNVSTNSGIEDLGALANKPIKDLNLSGTGIDSNDFGALVTLPLVSLDLSDTNITSIGPLTTNGSNPPCANTLEVLNISNTQVTQLQEVWNSNQSAASLPNLKTLTAQGLNLTSISGLVEIANATGFDPAGISWDISGSTLTDITNGTSHVQQIMTKFGNSGSFVAPTQENGMPASVYSAQSWMNKLKTDLALDGGKAKLTWDTLITAVYWYETATSEVSKLTDDDVKTACNTILNTIKSTFKSIETLDMSDKDESQYAISTGALVHFTGLKVLNLSGTGITEAGGLEKLTALEKLDLSNNKGIDNTSFGALVGMNSLKELNLSGTGVTDIGGLIGDETNGVEDTLETLDISNTGVTKLESIWGADSATSPAFSALKNLTAQNLALESISGLARMAAQDGSTASNYKWDLSGSTLTGTAANGDNLTAIQEKFGDSGNFTAPTYTASVAEDLTNAQAALADLKAELEGDDKASWDTLITAVYYYQQAQNYVNGLTGEGKTNAEATLQEITSGFAAITTLDMSGQAESKYAISTGALEPFTGLTSLNLSNTGISDTGGLVGLTSLEKLDLSGNTGINNTHFGALANMSSLEELNLSGTSVTDIGGLTGSNNDGVADTLTTLNISNTGVTKLQSVWNETASAFPQLKTLIAQGLELESISGLVQISNANGFDAAGITWDMSNSTLTNTETNLSNINELREAFSDAGTLNPPTVPVENMPHALERALCYKNNFNAQVEDGTLTWDYLITAIYWFRTAENSWSGLTDDTAKTQCAATWGDIKTFYANITELDMSNQNTSQYAISTGALTDFTGLTSLNLSGTGISDTGGLTGLTKLEKLDLSDNEGINNTHFGALANMSALKELNLSGTSVTDIGGLTGSDGSGVADTLTTLDISDTDVIKLESVWNGTTSAFPQLKNLVAKNLSLDSISGLVEIVNQEGFSAEGISWDLAGSTLPETNSHGDDNQNHINIIATKLNEQFTPPTVETEEPETVPVIGVTLDKTTATIKVGGTVTLTATITPANATNKDVTWSSSDPAIATVDGNGVVKGVATGKATITVTTEDGSKTATCEVTVTSNGGGTGGGGGTSGGGGGGGSSSSGYTITVEDTDHGSIRVSPSRASRGDTVTITVDPDTGYELGTLIVRDSNGDRIDVERQSDTRYTFEMPSRRVTVEATFVEITEEPVPSGLPFTDVHTGDWFYDAVEYAYENGMMDGIGNNLFSPNGTTTRAMIVTILHRLENQPASGTSIFTDVPAGQWYTNAVAWAAANGIVDGYGDGRFGPNDTITREQMAAILYRYAQFKGYDVSNTGNLSGYTDAAQVSEWARTAMGWANAQGLITGNTATTLNPTGSATRAEVATILMRFVENVAK